MKMNIKDFIKSGKHKNSQHMRYKNSGRLPRKNFQKFMKSWDEYYGLMSL